MEKIEFEQKFLEKLKQKTWSKSPRNNDLQEALKNYLMFIDEHKIYEFMPYENILKKIDDTEFKEDENGILGLSNALAFYDQTLEWVVFSSKKNGKHNRNFSSTVIHELTHVLSAQVNKKFDRNIFEKGSATQILSQLPVDVFNKLVKGQYDDETFDENDGEEAELQQKQKKRDQFLELLDLNKDDEEKVQKHRIKHPFFIAALNPVNFDLISGLTTINTEYNQTTSTKKFRQFYPTMKNYLEINMLNNIPQYMSEFDQEFMTDNMNEANEGVTDLIASLIDAKSNYDGLTNVSMNGYYNLIMLAAQLYCVFGDSLFEAYFSNSTHPMSKQLQMKNEDLNELLGSFSKALESDDEENINENNSFFSFQHRINDMQIQIAKLLERKILRELAKHNDKFTSPKYMHEAIESAFVDFSKHLVFGQYFSATDFDWERVYDQMEKSICNCLNFGNKLLARRKLSKMPPMSRNIRQQFIEETYANYYYVGKNTNEVTITNRLVPHERKNLGPTQKKLYADRWKYPKFHGQVVRPGEIFYYTANGADPKEWSKLAYGSTDVDSLNLKPTNTQKK